MLGAGLLGPERELALDHGQDAGRDACVEADATLDRHHVAFEVLAHRSDELGRRRPVVHGLGGGVRCRVGPRPCGDVAGGRRVDEVEQVPLLFGDTAAQRGELHRSDEPVQVRERLHLADHAPLQRAEHLPEVQVRGVDGVTGRVGVDRQQLLGRAESTGAPVHVAEPPRLHAEPAEVLDRVAEVREFPVEHRAQPLRSDDEVAGAEVAVHERGLGVGEPGCAFGQPTEPELERRMGFAEHVDHTAELVDERDCVLHGQPRQRGHRHCVDGRGRSAHCATITARASA